MGCGRWWWWWGGGGRGGIRVELGVLAQIFKFMICMGKIFLFLCIDHQDALGLCVCVCKREAEREGKVMVKARGYAEHQSKQILPVPQICHTRP